MSLADRRLASRFEIVGEQLGILDALEPLRVRNLSSEGMLLESPNPLAVGSIHEFQLIDGTTSVRVRAAVRHLSPLRQPSAERYFLVDLEFLDRDTRLSEEFERRLNGRSALPTPRGAGDGARVHGTSPLTPCLYRKRDDGGPARFDARPIAGSQLRWSAAGLRGPLARRLDSPGGHRVCRAAPRGRTLRR